MASRKQDGPPLPSPLLPRRQERENPRDGSGGTVKMRPFRSKIFSLALLLHLCESSIMKAALLIPLVLAALAPASFADAVKDREGAVRQDRAAMETDARWIY